MPAEEAKRDPTRIFLFDVDGTLTAPRKVITPEMHAFIADLRKKAFIGIVGGSDLPKQIEQIGENVVNEWDYVFSENGLVAFKDGVKIGQQSLKLFLGEDKLNKFINFVLRYLSNIELPCKRGTFIEFRAGMLNVSPVGRNCSQEERDAFEKYDEIHGIRATMVKALQAEFKDYGLRYSVGGQISFDVFPEGWDKTYCLPFLEKDGFKEIHFFGDKTFEGGNDFEIFQSDRTIGHTVTSPDDTRQQVQDIYAKL